jgi:hypothetical protein
MKFLLKQGILKLLPEKAMEGNEMKETTCMVIGQTMRVSPSAKGPVVAFTLNRDRGFKPQVILASEFQAYIDSLDARATELGIPENEKEEVARLLQSTVGRINRAVARLT